MIELKRVTEEKVERCAVDASRQRHDIHSKFQRKLLKMCMALIDICFRVHTSLLEVEIIDVTILMLILDIG